MNRLNVNPDRTTVAALYGLKSPVLAQLLNDLQSAITGILGNGFRPRPLGDVHSTIIGLDVKTDDQAERNISQVLRFLDRTFRCEPFTVQYGGYDPADRRMTSRGLSLYERSLTVDGDKVVLIGWPVLLSSSSSYTPTDRLAFIRHRCEEFGVRHKYHTDPQANDPDSYMVVGEITDPSHTRTSDLASVASEVLGRPIQVAFDESCLSLIQYVSFALPRATSNVWPLGDALRLLTA